MTLRTAIAAALVAASAAASAAPFATTYTGTIANSTFPEIISGQHYTVTLVVDNGGSTASGQTWTTSHLRCAIWRMNDAGDVVFTQNLAAQPPNDPYGTLITRPDGSLSRMYEALNVWGLVPGTYTASGFAPVNASWYANGFNHVFADEPPGQNYTFRDSLGGVQMTAAAWSEPQPFAPTAGCPAALAAGGSVQSVPTLADGALLALSALVLLAGLRLRRAAP